MLLILLHCFKVLTKTSCLVAQPSLLPAMPTEAFSSMAAMRRAREERVAQALQQRPSQLQQLLPTLPEARCELFFPRSHLVC